MRYFKSMGFRNIFSSTKSKQAKIAADQVWSALVRGARLEITAKQSTDDATVRMLIALRKAHPGVVTTMLQSKSIILAAGESAQVGAMSGAAHQVLKDHGYFPDSKLPIEHFLDLRSIFSAQKGDVSVEEINAKAEADLAKDAAERSIILTSHP